LCKREFDILFHLDDLNGLSSVTTAPFAADPPQLWPPTTREAVTSNDQYEKDEVMLMPRGPPNMTVTTFPDQTSSTLPK